MSNERSSRLSRLGALIDKTIVKLLRFNETIESANVHAKSVAERNTDIKLHNRTLEGIRRLQFAILLMVSLHLLQLTLWVIVLAYGGCSQ